MTKNEKSEIKSIIEDLLELRKKEIEKNKFLEMPLIASEELRDSLTEKIKQRNDDNTIEAFDIPLIKLNNLLKKPDQFEEVLEIEKHMKKIHSKKYITVQEMIEIYNISKTSQQNYRGRRNDPLPYHQKVQRGNITYIVEEVEEWLENQHK
jgi:ABC-type transporter lipoprotein component MlaA